MDKIYVVTIDEEFEKSRKLGSLDKQKRKSRKPGSLSFSKKEVETHSKILASQLRRANSEEERNQIVNRFNKFTKEGK